MFKPQHRSLITLVVLGIIALGLYAFAQTSYRDVKSNWYDEKMAAAKLMSACLTELKTEVVARGYAIDPINDPNQTGLIGLSVSSITTSAGNLSERLTALNPNLAGVMVDYLKQARLHEGDYVAVGLTGANPAANIALYAALETLKLKPIIIAAVGSSQYGANRPDFTWLDMETLLYDKQLISFKSNQASLGGGKDSGRGLSLEGREALEAAFARNNVPLINEGELQKNIDARKKIYAEARPENVKYRAFVNVGGGLANVGSLVNAKLIRNGVNRHLDDKNFSSPGIMMHFAKRKIPVVHIYQITKIAERYGMPIDPEPLPEAGTGKVFVKTINNAIVAAICLFILLVAIFIAIHMDRKHRYYLSNIVDLDEEL